MKRKILIVVGIIFVLSLPGAIGAGMFFWRFQAHPPPADYPAPTDATEARWQDLDYLLNLPDVDKSFSEQEADRFREYVASLQETVENLSDAEFSLSVARAVAITDNGHTNLSRTDLFGDLSSLPVRFYWFGDGLHIVRTRDEHAQLMGAKVVAYDGDDPYELAGRLDPFFGGNEAFLRYNSTSFFASPEAMHALGMAESPDQVTLTLQFPDAREEQVVVLVEDVATPMISPDDAALARPLRRENESDNVWLFPDPDEVTPTHYGRHPEDLQWTDELPGGGFFVRMRLILDQGDRSLSEWLEGLSEQLRADPAEYLVIDVRSAFGGDYTKARDFAQGVTDYVKPGGNIYLLTDGGTFSAAIVAHAFALEAGGEQAIVVGTEIGDYAQFWAEGGGMMQLPNSGHRIWVTTGYHDWENGCTDWSTCFWLNILMGVAAGPLGPDIVAPLTYADYSRGIDTTMQAVFEAEGVSN